MSFSQSFNFGNSTLMALERGMQADDKENAQPGNGTIQVQSAGNEVNSEIQEINSEFFRDEFSYEVNQAHKPVEQSVVNVSQVQQHMAVISNQDSEDQSRSSPLNDHICTENSFESEVVVQEQPNVDENSFLCPAQDEEASEQLKEDILLSHSVLAKQEFYQEILQVTQNLSSMSPNQLRVSPNSSRIREALPERPAMPLDLNSLRSISAWNLPMSIQEEYKKKGVVQMFDWQVECLSKPKLLFEHCNLVYSAPTSAGKTLVSEIMMLKTVLERGKKVLLILPFISVVREKMFYMQDLLTPAGYRVEGFYGGYTPPGGFESLDVAICTIEKANSIVNKLMEQGKLETIGMVVVDEVHLISDKGRGYILELLLAKILYMSRRNGLQIQVITMSATLANVQLLQSWLDAELYITNYRPVALKEMIKVGTVIYDHRLKLIRDVAKEKEFLKGLENDSDDVALLCIETLLEGCSVIVFCPSKDWCENLAVQLATAIHGQIKSGTVLGQRLRANLDPRAIAEVKQQLRDIPTGLDAVMSKAITYACAFHHAGLTTEERDIVEASFKAGALKVLVATSTLSSGVNLPARRVLIRSPLFGGKPMSSLTYRQMIGRAGRMGKDTLGESILICNEINARMGRDLVLSDLQPITSCLDMDGSTHLKRALLEVISSGVANTKEDIDFFVNCTLLSAEKAFHAKEKPPDEEPDANYINDALDFLVEYEFVRLQRNEEKETAVYVATRLGAACLASSMPPTDGLILFAELQKSRRSFVLESELHAVYLVTPYSVCYQLQDLDWLLYVNMWEKLTSPMKKVGEIVGVRDAFLSKALRGQTKLDYKQMQIHKRFYIALALEELVNETPINVVVHKFKCHRGMLQSLQQMAATFAGIVTAFCNSLQWSTLALIVSQFKDRLFFGIQRDLIDLMRIPDLSQKRARALFDAGITSLVELAGADALVLEKVLYNSLSFDSAKQNDNENAEEAAKRNVVRNFYITGKAGMTVSEAAKLLIEEARQFVQHEIGLGTIKWTHTQGGEDKASRAIEDGVEDVHMSLEEEQPPVKRKLSIEENGTANTQKNPRLETLVNTQRGYKADKMKPNLKEIEYAQNKTPGNPTAHMDNLNLISNDLQLSNEEKPSTSQSASKKLVKEGMAERRRVALMKIQQRTQKENQSKDQPIQAPRSNPLLSPVNRTPANRWTQSKNANNEMNNRQLPCRNPRNQSPVPNPNRTVSRQASNAEEDLFMADDSFMLNTGLVAALTAAESKIAPCAEPDVIPSSQPKEPEVIGALTPHASRLKRSQQLRSQRMQSHSPTPPREIKMDLESKNESTGVSSMEISDMSMENSLMKNPLHLNASHIMSCSKVDEPALSFSSIDIIDVCGHRNAFQAAVAEIKEATRLGFSVGLQAQAGKQKPLIGANLLINQVAAAENREAAARERVLFQVDDSTFISCVSFCLADNVAFYWNMQIDDRAACQGVPTPLKVQELCNLMARKDLTLVMHDGKEQLKMLRKAIPQLQKISVKLEDAKVANWLLQPDKTVNFLNMCQTFAPECTGLANLCGSGRGYSSYGLDTSSAILPRIRTAIESCVTLHILKGQIENLGRIGEGDLLKFFHDIEMPIQLTLCQMELVGFPAQKQRLQQLYQRMVAVMKKLETKIYEQHGSRFNLGSSQAVAKVLGLHRKAKGRVTTSRQVLEKLNSPISHLILGYRKLSCLLAKSIQPLMECCQADRIHGQSITYTATGRISMTEPNLQNVAKEFCIQVGADAVNISCRSPFMPTDEDRCLLSADFCQLEMRILAHMSQDKALLEVMNSPQDLFIAIAAHWNKIKESEVTPDLRNSTKQVCYGIVYGMGMRSLAESLNCSEQEARILSDQFHEAYKGIRDYTRRVVNFARGKGFVETITGRRRYLEMINSDMEHLKKAERQAVNSTIQGSAADIAKNAILKMEKNIERYREKLALGDKSVDLVMHLHDELIFEVPTGKAKKIAKVLSITMESCVKLSVPLKVKLRIGRSWGELKEISV
ncbi:DNA polymerase theta [Drosophila sechellia]|uniref:DNA polymerase theta n=1 Tax=Drosophila sechellia TaxID=7238 RepID=B4HGF6_DROSE|nr:DNA polymerase theta [Drosophila sechellia]EDW42404.1 GM25985 [Drosophila sechellia]